MPGILAEGTCSCRPLIAVVDEEARNTHGSACFGPSRMHPFVGILRTGYLIAEQAVVEQAVVG